MKLLEKHPEVCCTSGPIISQDQSSFGRAGAAARRILSGAAMRDTDF